MIGDVNITISPINIGSIKYYTVGQMGALTNRSEQTIYSLIKTGNSIRRMKSIKIGRTVLIPIEEYIEFPFTYAGTSANGLHYHYKLDGSIIEEEGECSQLE